MKSILKNNKAYKIIVPVITAVVILFIVILTARSHNQTVPTSIINEAGFGIFYPQNSSSLQVRKQSLQYISATKRVIFNATGPANISISFSEQATPQAFTDVPTAYNSLINSLNQYDSFESVNGAVYLVHPKELSGGETAVLNSKGTLLFAQPKQNLSLDQWRSIFNNLQLAKQT